jgi:hypothetical protein
MWTFTVDPARFNGPLGAYRHVMKERIFSRLVGELNKRGYLHSGRYFWVMETHKNGWPHWHLLIDASFVPFGDVAEIWNRIGAGDAKELFGRIQFSKGRNADKGAFDNAMHAAFYAMKYVVKEPEQGWPDWLLDYEGNVKRFSPSHGFYASCTEQIDDTTLQIETCDGEILEFDTGCQQDVTDAKANKQELKERGPYKRTQSIRIRVGQCGDAGLIYFKKGNAWAFLGRLAHVAEDIEKWFGIKAAEYDVPAPGTDTAFDLICWSRLGLGKMPIGNVLADRTGIVYSEPGIEGPEVKVFCDLEEEEMSLRWCEKFFDEIIAQQGGQDDAF